MRERQKLIDATLAYHSRTKHHPHRFAASPGYLDWETQPDPFRTYDGSERVVLPLMEETPGPAYDDLYATDRVQARQVGLESVGALFELALGLSAWKEYGETRWALRCNPSSGNLHPTEGYALLPAISGLGPGGVFHYDSRNHCLERRASLTVGRFLPESAILIGLSSVHWRESWKYGERAFRYCQHDLGHAIAAVRYAASVLGWSATLIGSAPDAAVAGALGLSAPGSVDGISAEDREHPGCLLLVGPGPDESALDWTGLDDALTGTDWVGRANALSSGHVRWSAIDEVAHATVRREDDPVPEPAPAGFPDWARGHRGLDAARIIKQRRSAVALDEATAMPANTFYRVLDRLLPRPGVLPWDAWPWPPRVHCAVFVHRVDDLPEGLYLFERSGAVHDDLRAAMRPDFDFARPAGCPDHLRLFRLTSGDFRRTAQAVSCEQRIAGAGAFSLGMVAEFADGIGALGAWWYRRLFWEAGMIGQVLYLEAEAAGVRGTGIGCYFDDIAHAILGIGGDRFQDLYHFTVGGPVEDGRLTTRPGYAHRGAVR